MKFYFRVLVIGIITVWSISATAQIHSDLKHMEKPKTGSWGDQGDGTFMNPILNSNYPDSDVEKFGDKWYMISSKGRYMKGMTILESEDLVNWSIVGGIVDSVDWYTEKEKQGEGVWAGDLVYHNNKWHCYFIDIDKGLFVSTSNNIQGPWSKPFLMMERKGMTDPAVYFDSEKKKGYLICNYEIVGSGEKRIYHNRLFNLSWDGMKIIDGGRDVYVESGAEAAKIYNVGGYFYLFFSEWTTDTQGRKDDRRQIVLRSKKITGPYERKILLERDPVTGRSSSQGALVQAPDKSWWYFHQLIQQKNTYEGRPQCLIPVKWENNWPVLGADPDGNEIGNTVWSSKKPVQGKAIRSPQTDDDFNNPVLGQQWLWDGNPVSHLWSLKENKGHIRLYGAKPDNIKMPYTTLPNKLMQRKMGKGKDTVTTKMHLGGLAKGQAAGLIVTGQNFAVLGAERDINAENISIYAEKPGGNKVYEISLNKMDDYIYLRAVTDGRKLKFAFSLDGKEFKDIKSSNTLLETRGFNGLFIGLFSKEGSSAEKGYADFDWFSYKYDGPKAIQLTFTE